MKKTLLRITTALVCLFAVCGTLDASAQRGEKTLGVAGGYSGYNNSGYLKAYFQYTIIEHLRLAPEIGYSFKGDHGASAFEAALDVQAPFRVARGFALYPLAGFSFNSWNYDREHGGGTANRAAFDLGGGMELKVTPILKFSLQGKYSFMNDTGGCWIDLGIGYCF